MKKGIGTLALTAGLTLPVSAFACSLCDGLDQWSISGSTTARGEYISGQGDHDASIYPFDGDQAFLDFDFTGNRIISPYNRWNAQMFGAFNGSEYRSNENGLVLERVALEQENGEAKIPYRLELGDHFAFFSFRTIQRALKGVQLDLQPQFSNGMRSSIMLFAGANQPTWTHFDPQDDSYAGASFLLQHNRYGSASANFVFNHRDKSADEDHHLEDYDQTVASLAAETRVPVFNQILTIEGEAAHFDGSHDFAIGDNRRGDVSDTGLFAQVSGRGQTSPVDYRVRFERYGEDYRPTGAVITPDRKSWEGHVAYRFASGLTARARALWIRDNLETINPLDTETVGINISGRFLSRWVDDLTGRVDYFVQSLENESDTVDQVARNLTIDLNKPLPAGWNGRLGLFYLRTNSAVVGIPDTTVYQVSLSADHAIRLAGFEGIISPGYVWRDKDGSTTDAHEISPTFTMFLAKGPHRVGFDFSYNDFDREGIDIHDRTVTFEYTYERGQNIFGVELERFDRYPVPAQDTHAYKLAAFWTHHFDKPAAGSSDAPVLAVSEYAGGTDVLAIAPGTPLDEVKAALDAEFGGAARLPGYLVYEGRMLKGIDQRQRLVVQHVGGVVKRSGLIIDIDDVGNAQDLEETFERVREVLANRYGGGADTFERGDFDGDLVEELDNGQFVRNTQWQTDEGSLRYGIPNRLDRDLRLELQHARSFPSLSSASWSFDEVK